MRFSHGSITILSGEIETGKTSFCQSVVKGLEPHDWDVKGIISPAVFDGNTKIAINALDLSSDEQRRLADLRTDNASPTGPMTKRWVFHPETIAWCNEVLIHSTPCDLLIVDELGPLEVEQNAGLLEGVKALDRREYRHAIVVVRPHLIKEALASWPDADTLVIDRSDPSTTRLEDFIGQLTMDRTG